MTRRPLLAAALASLASAAFAQSTPAAPHGGGEQGKEPAAAALRPLPLVHLQSDKGRCRLGDTLWARVHLAEGAAAAFPLRLELRREGEVLAEQRFASAKALAAGGELGQRFLLDPAWKGGAYELRALGPAGRLLHVLPLQVYATELPALDLRLRVLGDLYAPGQEVTATCRVRERDGHPVAGARLRARATFGPLVVEEEAGPTDAEGWATVRVKVPAEARGDGALSVGLEQGEKLAAVAAPVPVSASVGRVDAYPEGGAIVTGFPQRLALLVRDLDGRPTQAEGRVVDDRGQVTGTFRADRYGHALVDVPYAEGRSYRAEITRPPVARAFPLPGDTGHALSLRIEREAGQPLRVRVRARPHQKDGAKKEGAKQEGAKAAPGAGLEGVWVALASETAYVERAQPRGGVAAFPEPELLRVRWVVVECKGRALLKAPLVTGERWPFAVTIEPLPKQTLLPGRPVQVLVRTTFAGRPVSAELALSAVSAATRAAAEEPTPGAVPALAARALLQPCVHEGIVRDGADLFAGAETELRSVTPLASSSRPPGAARPSAGSTIAPGSWERRHAYLLVRGGYAFPPEGVATTRDAPPARELGRVTIPPMAPRPPLVVARREDETRRRATGLDRLLERAPWTREGPARPALAIGAAPEVRRLGVPRKQAAEVPGFGKLARRAPQAERVAWSRADTRDTAFWQARLRTDARGEARVSFPLTHELVPLALEAQGLVDGAPLVGRAELEPRPEVETRFELPEALRLGDTVELWVTVTARDGQRLPYTLEVRAPGCLTALERARAELDPRRHAARTKFLFRASALSEGSELAVVVTRGLFQVVHRRRLVVGAPEPILSVAAYGAAKSTVEASLTIPRDALPGSVRAEARVSPSRLSSAVDGLDSLLREPHGCFEQTTSSNYPNLVVLEALLARGADAPLLERAYGLATQGFARIKTFQHPDGGFSLWGPGPDPAHAQGQPEARYTAMGVMQLARYAALFQGKGKVELQRGLDWLERRIAAAAKAHKKQGPARGAPQQAGAEAGAQAGALRPAELLYAAMATTDAGYPWVGVQAALALSPRTSYERALQANVLLDPKLQEDPVRRAQLKELLSVLGRELADAEAQAQRGVAPKAAAQEQGVMHSVGDQLRVETTALALVAFAAEQRGEAAACCERFLLSRRTPQGGWYGTQATALSIRALATGAGQPLPGPVPVSLRVAGGSQGSGEGVIAAGRQRPLVLRRDLPGAEPGRALRLALALDAGRELPYVLSCSYRVAAPRTSPASPYLLQVVSPALLDAGGPGEVVVTIRRRPDTPAPRGQVVAQIQLPGGMRAGPGALGDAILTAPGLSHVERRDGAVVLYWSEAPLTDALAPRELVLRIPVVGIAEGHYRCAPSVIYPYYASGLEAYATGRDLRVLPAGSSDPAGSGPAGQASQATQATGGGRR
ncbi:MAG: hypothetical protein AB7N76_11190 [Planctomycetota bacterium]